ncbi:MAG TPA: hypothetical protein VGP55_05195 [Chitinophagaceae bacterium]|nr:hypothetical protein [Chitinophagaceae bacterium]
MPVIAMFYGLFVSMYYLDNKQHNHPHFTLDMENWKPSIKYLMDFD